MRSHIRRGGDVVRFLVRGQSYESQKGWKKTETNYRRKKGNCQREKGTNYRRKKGNYQRRKTNYRRKMGNYKWKKGTNYQWKDVGMNYQRKKGMNDQTGALAWLRKNLHVQKTVNILLNVANSAGYPSSENSNWVEN
jgi:hypothetical protein